MGNLVVGVVVDVLRKVVVESFQFLGVDAIATAEWDLVILNTPKFVVLNPEVGFKNFGGGGESEQGCIALGQGAIDFFGSALSESSNWISEQSKTGAGGGRHPSFLQERSSIRRFARTTLRMGHEDSPQCGLF